jgi:hypothetical protein
MLPPSRYPRQRFIITLTVASGVPAALVQGLIAAGAQDSWVLGLVAGLVAAGALMLPPIFIALYLLGDPTPRALGLVIAYAGLFTLMGAALFGVLFWYGLAFAVADMGGRATFTFIQVAVVAPYVVLGVAATRTAKELYGVAATRETLSQTLSVILLYVTSIAIASTIGGLFSSDDDRVQRAVEDATRHAVFRVQACAITYALAHPDSGYPRSLTAMGPSGQNCLDAPLAKGRPKRLTVEYEPAPPNEMGRTPSFIVRARARKADASGVFHSAIGDTSGFIGESSDIVPATRVGSHSDVVDVVADLRTCALLAREARGDRSAPSSVADMAATLGRIDERDLRSYVCDTQRLPYSAQLEARNSIGTWTGYQVSYGRVPDDAGRPTQFEIVARPITYGESGVRSYYMRTDGEMHVTLADRAANASDPVVPVCLYGLEQGSRPRYATGLGCARMPSIHPPVVTLVHDTVATVGQPFTVGIRDRSDRTRPADSTYEHTLRCSQLPGALTRPRQDSEDFSVGSELQCVPNRETRYAGLPDTVRIVVYTRDRTGALGKVEGVARLKGP